MQCNKRYFVLAMCIIIALTSCVKEQESEEINNDTTSVTITQNNYQQITEVRNNTPVIVRTGSLVTNNLLVQEDITEIFNE